MTIFSTIIKQQNFHFRYETTGLAQIPNTNFPTGRLEEMKVLLFD